MPFESLDPEAQKNYAAVNIRLGLPPDFYSHEGGLESTGDGPIILSSDPLQSHIAPKIITVASIAQLNDLVGISDHLPDDHIDAPPPPSDKLLEHLSNSNSINELWSGLTEADISNIRQAATVFVLGNSERVKEYEPLINTALFPSRIAYFASSDPFIINEKIVVKGTAPVLWNYDKIIMEPGGSIVSEAEDFKIECNNFVTVSPQSKNGYESADPGTDFVIDISVAGYDKAAPDGQDAKPGPQGPPGDGAVEKQDMGVKGCPWVCVTQAQNGKPGIKGGDGTPGSPGGRGQNQGTFTMTVKQAITGKLIIIAGGGNGQDGGKGGNGGDGGPGGLPGDVGTHGACTTKANQGPQGPGGRGAIGGKAGDGGDGNVVTIYYTSLQGGVEPKKVGGLPGNPGKGGTEGGGIPPGGSDGNGGTGINGKPSDIIVKQL